MKKWMSLLLAVVMALSLCVTAFAGGDTGARVYLTGDAADEVTGLKNGQRVTGNGDVAVRLNVQNDPEAEEYSVKLNGQTLEADHHTAQYHVYYMPAAALSAKAATLSVNARSSAATPTVTVKVGGETKTVVLPADGSTDASSPTEVTVEEFVNPGDKGVLDRIYMGCDDETVELGTGLNNKGTITNALVKLGDGYTASNLYFYKTPAAMSQKVYAVWNDDGTTRYYAIVVSRGVQSGLALGTDSTSTYCEGRIGSVNSYDSSTGCISGTVRGPWGNYDALNLYTNGEKGSVSIGPEWSTDKSALYYAVEQEAYGSTMTTAYFARPGFYWLPVTYTSGSTTIAGLLPMEARCQFVDTAKAYITAANSVMDNAPSEVKAELEKAISAVQPFIDSNSFKEFTYLTADGEYTTVAEESCGVQARNIFGGPMTNYALVENELNTILDLTAIFTTWGTDATLAGYQWQAYQKLTALGINGIIDVDSLADRDAYQAIRQAKWDLIHTTSEAGDEDAAIAAVNAVLKGETLTAAVQAAGLDALTEVTKQQAEPSVAYGDIDGNGTAGEIYDVIKIIEYYNDPQSEANRLTDEQLKAADVNADGKVDLWDVIEMIEVYNGVAAGYTGATKTSGGAE